MRTYAINGYTARGGGFEAASYGTAPNEVTTWLQYPEEVITLEPGFGAEINLQVNVPEGTKPGQYITAVAAGNAEALGVDGTENIAQITRYVVPVFITVPGDTTTSFEVGAVALDNQDGNLAIDLVISNTGDMRVRPKGNVELIDSEGNIVSSFPVEMQSVYARESTTLSLSSSQSLPAGVYSVRVNLEDPDTGVAAASEVTDLQFSGSGELAVVSPIQITTASVVPAPAADNVQFANVDAVITNNGDPVANAQLALIAKVNGEEVERFPISQSLSLPTGETPITTRYIPATGWTSGEWTFELLLETVEPNGAAVVVGRQPIEGSITIP